MNPPKDLWFKLFNEEAPPSVNLNLSNDEIIKHLKNSFLNNKSSLKIEYMDLEN